MLLNFQVLMMENSSDHLPVLISMNLPINEVSCEITSRFIPTH